jgi:hypothetical protein
MDSRIVERYNDSLGNFPRLTLPDNPERTEKYDALVSENIYMSSYQDDDYLIYHLIGENGKIVEVYVSFYKQQYEVGEIVVVKVDRLNPYMGEVWQRHK